MGLPGEDRGSVGSGSRAVSGAHVVHRSKVGALLGAAGRLTSSQMPVVRALLNGRCSLCLVDTGSERTIVSARVAVGLKPRKGRSLVTADGRTLTGVKEVRVFVGLQMHCLRVSALIAPELENLGVDCLLGGDVVDHMGGVTIKRGLDSKYSVVWGKPYPIECCGVSGGRLIHGRERCCSTKAKAKSEVSRGPRLEIDDKDFVATFSDSRWTVRWRWSGKEPKRLQTRIGEYRCTQAPGVQERYNTEVQSWISKGWLVPWDGPVMGIIPLLAVVQPTKDKVRPVMDYRELNGFVECHTGDDEVAVCSDKVRKWRQLQGELKVVDLKSAYLQIHVARDLWKYQVVRYKGSTYALTRLGFGLSCAPRIMTMILGKVLSLDPRIREATDHYIDDIVVRESVVSAQKLREHLARYGLVTKEPESLDGGRLLGIALSRAPDGHLRMSRGTALAEFELVQANLTKRGLFSLCGRLVGHYPVAGWLRPHCSFLKRLGCSGSWDEPIESNVRALATELLSRAQQQDPVRGRWAVNPRGRITVWTDASSLAIGVAIEVDGDIVEDASWLRKKSDHLHINVAELEALGRGINMAIAWGFKSFTVATDSRTVSNWMDNTIDARDRVRTKSAAEMLIKRRLGVIRETITEYGLTVTVRVVSTVENKADQMTRVSKRWLSYREPGDKSVAVTAALATGQSREDAIWAAHLPHHLGIDRTFYLVKQIRGDLSRDQVKRELAGCEVCQRIDPALREENLVDKGSIAVERNWCRVAADVTHYGTSLYLSMVDCGPSRFAIWRKLSSETAACIVAQLHQVVIEHGPFEELLFDNSTAFRSAAVRQFADEWCISLRFRAAYAPSGNGIVERNHRTIKRIAARGRISPEEATFWYNVTPRKESETSSVPSNLLFRYTWRVPYDINLREVEDNKGSNTFAVGDEVWVKPAVPSCTKQWTLGEVTRVPSTHVVCVDGMPRHVRDVRKRRYGSGHAVPPVAQAPDAGQLRLPVFGGGGCDDFALGVHPPQQEEEHAEEVVVVDPPADPACAGPADGGAIQAEVEPPRQSCRARRHPAWMADYDVAMDNVAATENGVAVDVASPQVAVDDVQSVPRRSLRERRPPAWMADYES